MTSRTLDAFQAFDGLLTDDERVEVEQVAARAAASNGSGDAATEATRLLAAFGHVYVDARVSGLCREGALELFQDAIRGR